MRHKRLAKKFGRSPEHRAQLMRMLCAALILNDRIVTTLKKAKQARKDAEKDAWKELIDVYLEE